MNHLKKYLALFAVTFLLLGLVACGSDDSSTPDYTASGTYTFDGDQLANIYTSTDYPVTSCGPSTVGTQVYTVDPIVSTFLTWVNNADSSDSMTFIGSSGGSIVDTWTYLNGETDLFTLTYNADETFTIKSNRVDLDAFCTIK